MKNYFLFACAIALSSALNAEKIASPDNNIIVNVDVDNNGRPFYDMTYKNKPVIKPSFLGLECKDDINLLDGFKISGFSHSTFDEVWQPVWGEVKDIRNNYNELEVKLIQAAQKREIKLRFRVYNEIGRAHV